MRGLLEIETLGGLTLRWDGKPVEGLASRKAAALLVYAAHTHRSHPRQALATLLWDDRAEERALSNLSVVLSSLRKALPGYLEVTRSEVAFTSQLPYRLDSEEFEEGSGIWLQENFASTALKKQLEHIESWISQFKGDFLEGFHIRNGQGFEEWAMLRREQMRRLALEGLSAIVQAHLRARSYDRGITHAAQLLELDPLDENGHRQMMLLHARTGNRAAALKHFEDCSVVLERELGVEPADETTQLYDQIKSSAYGRLHNLPEQSFPIIGRETELGEILHQIADPQCRLLTITGPGGIGKTSVAYEVARALQGVFLNGVFVVSLAAIESHDYLVQAVANSVGLTSQTDEDLEVQLMNFMRGKEVLLVLDNFEHILEEGSGALAAFLSEASKLKLLVTSRERLNLAGEQVFELEGLKYPEPIPDEALEHAHIDDSLGFGAVDMFAQAARRVRPDFGVPARDWQAVIRICHLVEGMPLALELAASWVRVLPTHEIAKEIEDNLDFLATEARDMPDRHRHIRAVFDHSWNLLTEDERRTFRQMSVFRGSFKRDAAEKIVRASLANLASLVDKSLLRTVVSDDGGYRYELHGLLRQYAEGWLVEDREELSAVRDRHASYYASFLSDIEHAMSHAKQELTLKTLDDEIDNVRAAWAWLCYQEQLGGLAEAMGSLYRFYMIRGLFQEGRSAFSAAAAAASAHRANALTLLAGLRAREGIFCGFLAIYDEAEEKLQRALITLRESSSREELAFTLNGLGRILRMTAKYAEAKAHLEESLMLLRELEDSEGAGEALNSLGAIALRTSAFGEAQEHLQASLEIRRDLADRHGIGRCLINLGLAAMRLGDYHESKRLLSESLEITEAIGDQWGMAAGLNNLGYTEEHQHHYDAAEELYRRSLEIKRRIGHRKGAAYTQLNLGMIDFYQSNYHSAITAFARSLATLEEIGDRWGITSALQHLGQANTAIEAYDKAWDSFMRSLKLAQEIGNQMYIERGIAGIAELFAAAGRMPDALEFALALLNNPPLSAKDAERALEVKLALERQHSVDAVQQVIQQARGRRSEELAEAVVAGKIQLEATC